MEYRIVEDSPHEQDVLAKAILRWLRNAPPPEPGHSSASGGLTKQLLGGAGGMIGRMAGAQVGKALAHQPYHLSAPPASPTGAPRPVERAGGPASRPAYRVVSPAHNVHSSHQMHTAGEITLAAGIHIQQLSQTGQQQYHIFVLDDRTLLMVQQAGFHHRWTTVRQNWAKPLVVAAPIITGHSKTTSAGSAPGSPRQARSAGLNVAAMSEWDKLEEAALRGMQHVPAQLANQLRQMLDALLTPQGMAAVLVVALAVGLFGEVAVLALTIWGASNGLWDLLIDVLHLFQLYYQTASSAKTEQQLDEAAEYFGKAAAKGLLDLADIFISGRQAFQAYRSMQGGIKPGVLLAYLEEVLARWQARRASGGLVLQMAGSRRPAGGQQPPSGGNAGGSSSGSGGSPPKPKGGAGRAAAYGHNWPKESLRRAIDKFAPGAKGVPSADGNKIIYAGPDGKQVVYDPAGNYFRIEDTKSPGRRRYLDMDGNIPNNKVENGKQKGRTQDEYNEVTHYKNTD